MTQVFKKAFLVMVGVLTPHFVLAAWLGNPARPVEEGKTDFAIVYDIGERDVANKDMADAVSDLESRRFSLVLSRALGPAFQVSARVLPGTGRLQLENSTFNPVLWGAGVGIRLSPPETMGPVHLGLAAAWDWAFGSSDRAVGSGHDEIGWLEGSVAAGASYEALDGVEVFGGLSLAKAFIDLEINGVDTDWESDDVWGGFLGASYSPNDAWTLQADLRIINESILGLSLNYQF